MDWKVRKNLAAGLGERGKSILHFKEAFHGRTGYTMSMTNTTDPRKDMCVASAQLNSWSSMVLMLVLGTLRFGTGLVLRTPRPTSLLCGLLSFIFIPSHSPFIRRKARTSRRPRRLRPALLVKSAPSLLRAVLTLLP